MSSPPASRPSPPAPDAPAAARRLATAFAGLVAAVLGLMVLGALVRAHGAGLACPDWPLCFGELVPRMDLKVAFEWSHRVVAGVLSLVFVGLAVLTARRPALWRVVRGRIALAAGLLAVQVLLGALTVWHLLAVWTVTAHPVTANLFAVTLLLVALRLRDRAAELGGGLAAAPPAPPAARLWIPLAAALLAVQVVLGGLVSSSYAGLACTDWPACVAGHWFPLDAGSGVALHLAHRTGAYALLAALAAGALAARRDPRLAPLTGLALGLGVAQVAAGVANVLLRLPVEVTGLHSALAAALVLTVAAALHATFARRAPASAPGIC